MKPNPSGKPGFRSGLCRLASRLNGFVLCLVILSPGKWAAAAEAPALPGAITREAVLKSLAENTVAWKARVEGPRPHLYFNGMDLKEVRKGLRSDGKALSTFLDSATKIAAKPLPPYISPEEEMKARGLTRLAATAQNWQRPIGYDLAALCVAALADDAPAYREKIRQTVLEVCHYPTWGSLANVPNSDLACGHLAVGVAMAWDWFPELWSDEDRSLILRTVRERANGLLGGGYGKVYWYNTFDHNHNHVGVAALGICGAAFFNEIPEAPEWLAFARLNFQKVARVLAADGSSPEGVSYWSYGMAFILQYIEATRGVIDSGNLYDAPFLKNTAAYRLHVSTSGFQGILPWGDGASLDYSGPRQILYRVADQYHDDTAWWLAEQIPRGLAHFNLLWGTRRPTGKLPGPQTLDHYFRDGDIVTTRTGWGGGDYLLSLKSGFANRAHSHLDIGALALAFGNEWLLTAPGYGKDASQPGYWRRKDKRWEFFAPSTESHSTLLVNGENQRFDMKSRGTIDAFFSTPLWMWIDVDLAGAYHKVSAMRRGVLHRRGEYILVLDSAEAPGEISLEWLAQPGREPVRNGNALEVIGENGSLRIEMLRPAKPFAPRKPTVPKVDVLEQDIHTQAVKETGRSVQMIALLTPGFGGVPMPELKSKVQVSEDGREEIEIHGPGWTDRICHGKPGVPAEVSIPGLHVTAQMIALRTTPDGLHSFIATAARELDFAGVGLKGETPCDLGFQQTSEGLWIVDCSRKLDESVKLPEGQTLAAVDSRSGNALSQEGSHRYILLRNKTDVSKAQQWLSSLLHDRAEPPLEIRLLPEQPPISPEIKIPIEAESFNYQSKGNARVQKRPGATGGKAVTDVSGSRPSFGWQFTAATAGRYKLRVRYASPKPDLRATIVIDNAVPGEAMKEVLLPAGDGFGSSAKNWKEVVLSDSSGSPLLFNLSAGKHELGLSRITAPVELDSMVFIGGE